MNVQPVTLDRAAALEKFRDYKKHLHYSTPVDDEIRRTYQKIAQGKTVIKALESITVSGLNEQNLPKLAIVRADMAICRFRGWQDGSAKFRDPEARPCYESRSRIFKFPAGSFPGVSHGWSEHEAIVPLIPVGIRPKRALQNYHILWEAEWTRKIPIDPMLLRRMGKGDLWLVVGAWDLTEVERAALAARL